MQSNVGAGLLAKAVYQLANHVLKHRFREQARPHILIGVSREFSGARMHKGHPKVAFVWVKRQLSTKLT